MSSSVSSYRFDQTESARHILSSAADRFPHQRQTGLEQSTTYFDTFDWRLFRRGEVVYTRRNGRYQVLQLARADGTRLQRAVVEERPGFVRDLPAGTLRQAIESTVAMRRLLPVVTVEARLEGLNILDGRQKTVARIHLVKSRAHPERGQGTSSDLPVTIQLSSVRGYEERFATVRSFLEQSGCEAAAEDEFTLATRAVDIVPGDYSRKLELKLAPAMPAEDALRTILQRLLDIMRQNEPGLRQNIDSEFLHDFRVSVRRTRSALTQLGGVFPPETIDHFKAEFSWLGQITGPTRDLDVYQLEMPGFRESLPESMRSHLDPLADFIERHREIEHRDLVRWLDSDRYRRLLEQWQEFLRSSGARSSGGPEAVTPIGDLASRVIGRSARKVLKRGRAIEPDSPPKDLHRLRIQCKKLRYLLEFFRSLYAQREMALLIQSLKQLQDNLGIFNDLELQQSALQRYAQTMMIEKLGSADALMAMGRLVARLEQRQVEQRQLFHQRFEEFASRQNRRRIGKLFRQSGAEGA